MVAEGGNRDTHASCRLQNGRSFLGGDFFSINLQVDFTHDITFSFSGWLSKNFVWFFRGEGIHQVCRGPEKTP
jgi:hypothetical protein